MLLLKDIIKDYQTGSETVNALKGVSIAFRESEFVSILGQSGCGKTTLLNIIGGLDRYSSGDLIINGKSTKDYRDGDWDTYRNHSIGFVFQSYNLITHQTVLSNVELALTLSGVSKEERRERAIKALEKVGLGNQLKKKPTQMSGGQMQRVAIARALVNDPDILLADEPTGALDSATSVQIMELLKEISKEKLVIMVTHNAELADEYSTRIIKLHDGLVTSDTKPYSEEELLHDEEVLRKKETVKKSKKQMSFFTALSLSFNNLMTKKGRTILTAFAGSIGIIGIALILSLSTGIQTYINQVQEETLSSYPVQIQEETTDLSSMLDGFMQSQQSNGNHPLDDNKVYSNSTVLELFNSLTKLGEVKNNLKAFRKYLIDNETLHSEYITAIKYSYNLDLNIVSINDKGATKVNPSELMNLIMQSMFPGFNSSESSTNPMSTYSTMMGGGMQDNFCEIIAPNDKDEGLINELIKNQYDLIHGSWPTAYNEMVLIVNSNNEISDLALYSLGIKDQEEFKKLLEKWSDKNNKEEITIPQESFDFEDITDLQYRLVLPTDYFTDVDNDGVWEDRSNDIDYKTKLYYYDSEPLKITGIIRPAEGVTSTALSGSIGYTYKLTEWYIDRINESLIVKQQTQTNKAIDVFTGLPFATNEELTKEQKLDELLEYLNSISDSTQKIETYKNIYITPDPNEVETAYNDKYSRMSTEEFIVDFGTMLYMADKMSIDPKYATKEEAIEEIRKQVKDYGLETVKQMHKYYYVTSDNPVQKTMIMTQRQQELKAYKTDEEIIEFVTDWLGGVDSYKMDFVYKSYIEKYAPTTYEDNLRILGVVDKESPSAISIYAKDFHSKEKISQLIEDYNKTVAEEDQISYTDFVAIMMSGVSTIIDAISYVLIGFVSISLVVSSIMIGIITYISVLERTKEIGILRAVGASKRDVSRVFTAETIIEGFAAGAIGIGVTVLLCIPLNMILKLLSGISSLEAKLPPLAGLILVAISILLTLIAGFFPSRLAAKKDPVEALRTE